MWRCAKYDQSITSKLKREKMFSNTWVQLGSESASVMYLKPSKTRSFFFLILVRRSVCSQFPSYTWCMRTTTSQLTDFVTTLGKIHFLSVTLYAFILCQVELLTAMVFIPFCVWLRLSKNIATPSSLFLDYEAPHHTVDFSVSLKMHWLCNQSQF